MSQDKSDIRSIATARQISQLRKQKTLPERVKTAIYDGCKSPLAANQFHYDLRVYGLWEALLYTQNGEPEYYQLGTAETAFNKALLSLPIEATTNG